MYIYSNVLGIFVFDAKLKVIDKLLFDTLEKYRNKEKYLAEIKNKHKNTRIPNEKELLQVLLHFKDRQFFDDFHIKNLELTKFDLKNSVNADTLVIQAMNSVDDIDKITNVLAKRLREWYELYNPEFSMAIKNNEKFVEDIAEKEKKELLAQIKVDDSFGAELSQEDLEPIRGLAQQVFDLFQLRKSLIAYMSESMDGFCPNLKAVCGTILGAKLLEHAGSLKRLSRMPSSTIQILGAEQALFRHLKTGSKPPRHGIIIGHELIAHAPDNMHGKIARALSDKISIAVKIDYFNGQFIGDKLRKELDEKFGKND